VAMNDDADANVWSSGSQRLRGVFTDRLDDALCRLFTSTEGANASTTLTDSASTAHIVDIIVNLMVILCSTLELELLSMSYQDFANVAGRRRSSSSSSAVSVVSVVPAISS
jgi:hypothetical protein